LVTLIDEDRQWFKSTFGLFFRETARDISFCGHTILQSGLFIVPATANDERFADNPLVVSDPKLRFYAGAPLVTAKGFRLGTLNVADRRPRQLTPKQQENLQVLSRQVMAQIELRRQDRELQSQTQELAANGARLREREDQLRLYALHSPAAIAMFDLDMKYLVANQFCSEAPVA